LTAAQNLVEAWDALPKLPGAYAWRWIAYHLVQAGRKNDMRQLLLDFNYLEAKLAATYTNALIADYDYLAEDKDLQLARIHSLPGRTLTGFLATLYVRRTFSNSFCVAAQVGGRPSVASAISSTLSNRTRATGQSLLAAPRCVLAIACELFCRRTLLKYLYGYKWIAIP
jgi:hypothetical protein